MDVDDEGKDEDKVTCTPLSEGASDVDLPPAFKYALQLTFAVISLVL